MFSIRVSQILTSREEDALEALKELKNNVSFAAAVENFSDCPSKKNEGIWAGVLKKSAFSIGGKNYPGIQGENFWSHTNPARVPHRENHRHTRRRGVDETLHERYANG